MKHCQFPLIISGDKIGYTHFLKIEKFCEYNGSLLMRVRVNREERGSEKVYMG